jgi:hypothetical protein
LANFYLRLNPACAVFVWPVRKECFFTFLKGYFKLKDKEYKT